MTNLKVLPLGGNAAVTKNLYLYEYGRYQLIVDCGIGFPPTPYFGIDVLIPDFTYLKDSRKKIVGVILTHGHDDHIAALPYLLAELGPLPVYASPLTAAFAQVILKDFQIDQKIQVIDEDDRLTLGPFVVETIHVTHSVPDTRHLLIHTPVGTLYHGTDFKFDLTPVDGRPPNFQKIAQAGANGVLCLLSDCLRADKPGFSLSESLVKESLQREIRGCQGKFIVTTMSSNIHRIQQAVEVALADHRKVAFVGRSLEQNIKSALAAGFLNIPRQAIIKKQAIRRYPSKKLCIVIAGCQAQPDSSLVRLAQNDYPHFRLEPQDKVVFSADPIPGNEQRIHELIDQLLLQNVEVSYSEIIDDLHISGHASAEDLKLLIQLLKPRYLVPIGGTYRHLYQYAQLAQQLGYSKETIFLLKEGETLEFSPQGKAFFGPKLSLKQVIVDGTRVGDVGPVVLADRQRLASDGVVVVIIPCDQQGRPRSPQIISRGFVFMKKATVLVNAIKQQVESLYPPEGLKDFGRFTQQVEKHLSAFLFEETGRQPLILPLVVKI